MQTTERSSIIRYGFPIIIFGLISLGFILHGKGYEFSVESLTSVFVAPCEKPVAISMGTYDDRFAISRATFEASIKRAMNLWNSEADRELFVYVAEGGIPINLVYSEHQRNAELGQSIDADQVRYDAKRLEVEQLRSEYQTLAARYEALKVKYEKESASYNKDVAAWNAKGGAPPAEYARLQAKEQDLKRQEQALATLVAEVNALVDTMNNRIDELDALANMTNRKVNQYNSAVGEDFDQGTYTKDADGERISIFEFTDTAELTRVLAHEFGHALGLGHVENPESIMYSYDVGTTLALTPEDLAEYRRVCRVK